MSEPELLHGRNSVREALRGRRRVLELAGEERALASLGGLASNVARVRTASRAELDELCGSPDHQGVCAEVSEYEYVDARELLRPKDALVVALDQVQDPRNLGAVCRVAEVAGAAGVVIGERRSAQVTPVVCRASAGAVEHLAVARVRNVADFLLAAKEDQAWVYGASPGPKSVPYDQPDYSGRVVLVLGSEGSGLRPRVADACDQLIALPVRGKVESLNVSAAAAALVYGILQSGRSGVDKVP